MSAPLKLVPKSAPEGLQNYTQAALAALDEARDKILRAEKDGKPCTHVVVCLVAEYMKGKDQAMSSDFVTSAYCSDLAAVGVLQLCVHDYWG